MKKITFEVSDEAFDLLQKINKKGYAEYHDAEYETKQDFLKSELFHNETRTLEWFMERNFNGTYFLLNELLEYGLVDSCKESWHRTYVVTKFGKQSLK